MRKKLAVSAIGLLVAGLSSAFWMVSAADPTATVRMTVDVPLEKDSDFLSGFVPSRTTIAHLFQNHMIHNADTPVLVSSIASAIDVRKLRAGQPYTIDRLLDGRVRRFEYEIDADQRLTVERASSEGAPRFVATVERIPKQTTGRHGRGRDQSRYQFVVCRDRQGRRAHRPRARHGRCVLR
jgi:hypothetical protein